MLSYNELKKGVVFILDGEPYEILEYEFLRMQQRKPVAKCKIKNLISNKIVERAFHQNESFEKAEIVKEEVKYLYSHRPASTRLGRQGEAGGEYWFSAKNNPAQRFLLKEEFIGPAAKFLKSNSLVTALKFNDKIIGIRPPIKVDLTIKEAPPGFKGDTATGGTKKAILETGAEIDVPLFVNTGDIVRVNTETGEYAERTEKADS